MSKPKASAPAVQAQPDHEPGHLAHLITARREALGLTYRTLAEQAGLTQGGVHKLANNTLTWMPKQATLHGLARALRMPVGTLVQAATADLELSEFTISDDDLHAVTVTITHLTAAQQHAVRTMIESYEATRESGGMEV